MADQPCDVSVGVETHLETHTAVVVDFLGRVLETITIDAGPAGFRQLLACARRHGRLVRAGVEVTGAYGAGLARFLTDAGIEVIEVDRPNRQRRRRRGKSHPTDAEATTRAVLAGGDYRPQDPSLRGRVDPGAARRL
jgi:transposase